MKHCTIINNTLSLTAYRRYVCKLMTRWVFDVSVDCCWRQFIIQPHTFVVRHIPIRGYTQTIVVVMLYWPQPQLSLDSYLNLLLSVFDAIYIQYKQNPRYLLQWAHIDDVARECNLLSCSYVYCWWTNLLDWIFLERITK